jgi:hypothetical protein
MYKQIAILFILLLPLSLGFALISAETIDAMDALQSWDSFFAVFLLAMVLVLACWFLMKREEIPAWVGWLLLGAIALRLIIGAFWFVILPQWGYGSGPEEAGYIMADAHRRDTVAWELAQSEKPLLDAFEDYRYVDQYGGFLFFSASIYRYFGADFHTPLLIVILTAAISGLAVLFTWAFTQRLWDRDVAYLAAWLATLYPEAILLGSTQMREALMMPLAAMALYGLVSIFQKQPWQGVGWLIFSLGISIPLSPTFTILLIIVLVVLALFMSPRRLWQDWRFWAALLALILIGLLGLWLFGAQIVPGGANNPLALLRRWTGRTSKWQMIVSQNSSGWMYKLLEKTNPDLYKWIVLAYGVMQPFLPAALIAGGNLFWHLLAIWRALGWNLLLPFLLYAPLRAIQKRERRIALGASLAVWIVILSASFRSGGDLWDNPRYRAAFFCLQVALVAWAWVNQQREPDPWFRRMFVGVGFVLIWFVPWYLRRYTPLTWPVIDVFKTFGLGVASAILYWIWDWVRLEARPKET